MKKILYIFFLLDISLCSLILFSSIIYGQSYQTFQSEIREITQRAKWRLGPFRIYPTIQFRDIGYDDNVYRKREEDNPISDYTATISPQVRVYLLFRNWLILSFMENPEYVYFVKEKRERSFNNNYSPSLKFLILHRFVLTGNYQYIRRRRRATSEFDIRANERRREYRGSLFYETARGTSFGISAMESKIAYEDITLPGEEIDLSRRLNREERNSSFEFYYRAFSESFFFINAGYTEYNFEYKESQWRNSYSYQIYSGIRFPLLGRLRGTLSLGYKTLKPRRKGIKSFSGLVGNTGLNLRTGRFGFRVQYNRDSWFSFSTSNIYFLEDSYGAGISLYLTGFLRLDYDFSYRESNYPETLRITLPQGNFQEIKRKDTYYIHSLGFVIRVIRNTGVGIRYNYWERDSNIPRVGRKRWFVGGYITYEF